MTKAKNVWRVAYTLTDSITKSNAVLDSLDIVDIIRESLTDWCPGLVVSNICTELRAGHHRRSAKKRKKK
jgi:hypothetical protein